MARQCRDVGPGIFHVYAHSVRSDALFRDDLDRMTFLRELARAGTKCGWTCVAYCLMTTHFHLILKVKDGALPVGMHAVNFRYAAGFNRRHDTRGHVLEARYGSRRIRSGAELLTLFVYVVRNPVAAGLALHPVRWLWSSYWLTVAADPPPTFVDAGLILGELSCTRERAVTMLRAIVEKS
jgi:putative transposase